MIESNPEIWYEKLREKYRPDNIEVLLIAESPPDPGDGNKRFFYSPTLSQHDNLYRGVAEAVYGSSIIDSEPKPRVLERLCKDGYWLIDAVEQPINKLSKSARRSAIRSATPHLIECCIKLKPRRGVIVCHKPTYEIVAAELRAHEVIVLHDEPLPFPLGNWRADFVAGMRNALHFTK